MPQGVFLLSPNCGPSGYHDYRQDRNYQCPHSSELPWLEYVSLPPYGVNYAANAKQLPFKEVVLQLPRILRTIKAEHSRLHELIDQYQINAVISDNRYGLYTNKVPCVFTTHQLNILIPQSAWLQKWVNQINHKMIRRFTQCWVPDEESERWRVNCQVRVAGLKLSYIGLLTARKSGAHARSLRKTLSLIQSGVATKFARR